MRSTQAVSSVVSSTHPPRRRAAPIKSHHSPGLIVLGSALCRGRVRTRPRDSSGKAHTTRTHPIITLEPADVGEQMKRGKRLATSWSDQKCWYWVLLHPFKEFLCALR